ncbi:hypothetical protein CTAYLR_010594 [Chrysophaeum taylorii]|uniref:ornithine carbamoyltransferase n=1 Tax=Chrysophaeum taylorii TaxID=2483200 RepID=A0AAD7UH57_9STRA|nr:hypothetical protein CTAYLR_010594 [Chrysophaeum taylorii]
MVRHVKKITSLTQSEVRHVLSLAARMKAEPARFENALWRKSLLMLFEKPSLRTRVSLEVGMTQLGGHAIAYMTGDSPIGQKESYEDTAAVVSRMADAVTARVKSRSQIDGLCSATVPVINALDDFAHPMQMLADLLTIEEKKKGLTVKLGFVGDLANNVTYDLIRSGWLMGFEVRVAGTGEIEQAVYDECSTTVNRFETAEEAVKDCDVVYADSWLSYGVDSSEDRLRQLMPFQVTSTLMQHAKPDAVFMNCLPAMRGQEQTADVIDGPQSIVFDQAENRLHAQKALLVALLSGDIC